MKRSVKLIVSGVVAALLVVALPSRAVGQTETRTGFLNVVWVDSSTGAEPEMRLYLSDAETMTRLRPVQGAALDYQELHRMDGRIVVATGTPSAADLPGGPAPAAFDIQNLRLERPPLPAPADTAALTGAQPWVSVLCKFADSTVEPKPRSFYQTLLTGDFPSADSFWREVSYDAIDLAGSIAVGWFKLPQPRSYYVYDADRDGQYDLDFRRAADDCAAAGDSQVDYTAYAGINFVFNTALNCCAYGGSTVLTVDGVTANWRATWLPPWANTPAIHAHEMGHGFGFPHSSGPSGYGYDSKWDVMSWAWAETGPGTISFHKTLNDWIPQSRIAVVNPGSSITVSLERLSQPTTAASPLMVKVPIRGSGSDFYTVEFRRRVGYDDGPSGVVPGDAVVIHHVMTGVGRDSPARVVVDPAGSDDDPNGPGAMWIPGESFVDQANGIRISVLSASSTAATVLVTQSGIFEETRITTLAGAAGQPGRIDGMGDAARFNRPLGIAVGPDGVVYVADALNHVIRRVTPGGAVTTVAGTPGVCGHEDAVGVGALFCYPSDVAVGPSGTLFVADAWTHTIRMVSAAGAVTTLAGSPFDGGDVDAIGDAARFNYPSGIAVAADGTVYVTTNHTVRRVTSLGEVTTLAGKAGVPGSADGVRSAARFNGPFGVAVDRGTLYVADRSNHRIRTVTVTGVVSTLAGSEYGEVDGVGTLAQFASPYDVAVDPGGTLYIVDSGGHTLRKMTSGGAVTTSAGSAFVSGVVDGAGGEARFFAPQGVAVGPSGLLYITDNSGHTLRTVGSARLTLSPTALRFGAVRAASGGVGSVTSPQAVLVNTGSPAASWRATSADPWVRVTDASGTGTGAFMVGIDPALVPAGAVDLATNLTVALPSAGVTTTVTVWLTVLPIATTTAAPVGSFDTPADGTIGAHGSIAVTGWAVDDIDVSRVELWRDVAPGETTPAFAAPGHPAHGKIFIANMSFVTGARPDVEAAYWDRPHVQQSGWGYMLLTWGLWGQGNGTYTLHALAYDPEGHVASLGTRTIAVDNRHATRPFGAIDTPTYGGTASGANFVNFGWALTPPANSVDPRNCAIDDGGVLVSVDSGPLTPVVYGSNRPDVEAGFPTFSNAAGAGGHYLLDATTLANGVHTIGWLAVDSCGRMDGMGSRFFTVEGSAADASPAATTIPAQADLDPVGSDVPDAAVASVPVAVSVRRNLSDADLVAPTADGLVIVEVAQGDRIEVQVGVYRRAWHVVSGQRRQLPIGSSYDAALGTFYWQPLEAYLGAYDLEFALQGSPGRQPGDSDAAGTVRLRVVVGPPMRMAIDVPRWGDVVSRSFRVAGWALDLAAADLSGVDTVHVWAYPAAGGAPIFLGVAAVGGVRPDVAAVYGASFASGGYELQTTALATGDYDVVAYAHRAATNAFEAAQVVHITVR